MSNYKATIGLEIHAELATQTKMFCDSKNDPDEKRPNVNICPVCTAHPGTLPTINKRAVEHVINVGRALKGTIADFAEFDRKNYFYPDIPKGYQISQYKFPLVLGGSLNGIDITRVHLEEDTARSIHLKTGDESLVDFNRAGVPLMELVTEPVIHDAKTAGDFARELQLLLRYLGASEANMEKGEMRVEANVSVSKDDTLGTKVELKNLNSFKIVEKAIDHEIARHTKLLEKGETVMQETRGWNESRGDTFSQRTKEEAQDYRYFPDPDLPKLKLSELSELTEGELPELPWERRARFKKEYDLKDEDVEMYVRDNALANYAETIFSELAGDLNAIKLASNYLTTDVISQGLLSGDPAHDDAPRNFAALIRLAQDSLISSNSATALIPEVWSTGRDPKELAEEKGLIQKSDEGELTEIVKKVISENENVVLEYRSGKEASLKFLVGQGMKASQGAANPQVLAKLFKEELK